MTMHDDDRSGDDGSRTAPRALVRPRRRLKMVAGAAGLAAILGPSAYFTTTWLTTGDSTETRDVTAIGQPAPLNTASPATSASASAPSSPSPAVTMGGEAALPEGSASPDPTKDAKTVEEEIKEAREKAAKDGHPVRRALTPGPEVAQPVGEVEVTNEGHLGKDGKTLRLVAAHYDLTGQRELLWAAGKEKKVGNATCTQRFKFSNEGAPVDRPTMISCWRTSAEKSVVAIAVVREGRPDAKETVAELNKKWNKLG